MAGTPSLRLFTPEEYLSIEREAEFRSEYLDGQILAMSGGTITHSQITTNTALELAPQLRDKPCRVLGSGMRVAVSASGPFFYPDVLVVCGPPQLLGPMQDLLMNPALVVEVLSPSTRNYDRGPKFLAYQEMTALKDYLLVSQHQPFIEHHSRQADGAWLLRSTAGLDGVLSIPSIGCQLRLSEVYRLVEFTEA